MGLVDKFKSFVGADDTYEDEMMDGDLIEDEDPSYGDQQQTAAEEPARRQSAQPSSAGYQSSASMGMSSAIELRVMKPTDYASVTQIADNLLARRTVVLNLEATNKDTARRLIDFLSGVAYSIQGQLKRVANNTFVITPNNVDVSGEQLRSEKKEEPKPEPQPAAAPADDLYSNL